VSIESSAPFGSIPRLYGPLARRMAERALADRVPLRGSIELTHRCNLACVHCYVNLPAADRAAQRREMTTAEVFRVVDELVELGCMSLTLTGGEPLLRPDFAEIYRYIHTRGIVCTVYTNATLITDRILALFEECPPGGVDITMYGHSHETYDAVTNAGPGQATRFYRGLKRLLDAGVRVSLKTVAIRSNLHEILAIREYAHGLGLDFRLDGVISPRIDGGRGPLKERLTADELADIETATSEMRSAWADFCDSRKGQKPDSDDLYQCGAGNATFLIDPYGKLHVCELSRTLGWDVLADGFAAGWYGEVPSVRAKKRSHDEACGSCYAQGSCSNCVGMAELERLQPEDGNPYFCDITDARNQRIFGEDRPQPQGLVRLRLPSDAAAMPK
jgi:radical SAM protein with 4Fe4S-binding SPASM domain